MTASTSNSLQTDSRAADVELSAKGVKIYRVGTLAYTGVGLSLVFFWMLWGDFCFTVMELVIPNLVPLSLKNLGASNQTIAILVGTIPGVMNVVVTPIISFRSDRHRGPLGRRIPYLLWPTPLIALFMIVTGFAEPIGHWLHHHIAGSISPTTLIIGTIAVASVAFQYFHLLVASIYYYLFRDVVPQEFLGRFIGMFRVVGAVGAFLFDRYVMGWADTHRVQIYLSIALLYCVAFLLMCWRVKEGEYPPPEEATKRRNPIGSVISYFRECFTEPRYVFIYAASFCYCCSSSCQSMFGIFFAQKNLNMSTDAFGDTRSWTWFLALFASLPLGYLCDKVNPLKMTIVGIGIICSMMLCGYFFITDQRSFLLFTLLWFSGATVYQISLMPALVAHLPADRFGQFCSANALCGAMGISFGSFAAGRFLDLTRDYRLIYLWSAFFTGLSFIFFILVLVQSRRSAKASV